MAQLDQASQMLQFCGNVYYLLSEMKLQDIASKIGQQWRNMSPEQKQVCSVLYVFRYFSTLLVEHSKLCFLLTFLTVPVRHTLMVRHCSEWHYFSDSV